MVGSGRHMSYGDVCASCPAPSSYVEQTSRIHSMNPQVGILGPAMGCGGKPSVPTLAGHMSASSATGWKEVFLNSSFPCGSPPGIAASSVTTQQQLTSPPSIAHTSLPPQANAAFNLSSVAPPPSHVGGSVVPSQLHEQSHELRKDRTHLPKCDVHFDPSNPASTLTNWETYVLRC
eukprot:3279377-Amphidinium_carterae.1